MEMHNAELTTGTSRPLNPGLASRGQAEAWPLGRLATHVKPPSGRFLP